MRRSTTTTRAVGQMSAAAILALTAAASGCSGTRGQSTGPSRLEAQQTLTIGYRSDPDTLDPAQATNCLPDPIISNVFDGLYRIDARLKEVPDLAAGAPQISPDGTTYTFRIRRGVRFSNGDALTARDVKYSWTRAALASAKAGGATDDFWPIAGYDDLSAGRATALRGITVADDQTLTVTLSHPAAHWLAELVLPPYDVVDQRVIEAGGQTTWWQSPGGLVGTGSFRMTARTPGRSLDFEPVAHWWGGPTGTLTHIHVEVAGDNLATEFQSGRVDYIGAPGAYCDPKARLLVLHFLRDLPGWAGDVHTGPPTGTFFVRVATTGQLAGAAGKLGRIALSEAIDRQQLVRNTYIDAIPATGGPIAKALEGYLGDNTDPYAHFDPSKARNDYLRWDPDGSKAQAISYVYNTNTLNDAVAQELRAQWHANLGITVNLKPVDGPTFFETSAHSTYTLARFGWAADYDDPQDWFSPGALNPPPPLTDLARQADAQSHDASLTSYQDLSRKLVSDALDISLAYAGKPWLARPYVQGVGQTTFSELPWIGIQILAH